MLTDRRMQLHFGIWIHLNLYITALDISTQPVYYGQHNIS